VSFVANRYYGLEGPSNAYKYLFYALQEINFRVFSFLNLSGMVQARGA
jgi:hypothetical protein